MASEGMSIDSGPDSEIDFNDIKDGVSKRDPKGIRLKRGSVKQASSESNSALNQLKPE